MEYKTGAKRCTGGKGRCDLLPAAAVLRISRHMENSLEFHEERNWEKGLPMHTMIDSALRHLLKYMDGMTDEDHLTAAATNLLMAIQTEEKMPEMQDIPSRKISTSYNYSYKQHSNVDEHTPCDCYDAKNMCCNGTKEQDPCGCGGVRSKCDFYAKA